MLMVLATWALLLLILQGLGLGVQRCFGLKAVDSERAMLAWWMGLAGTIIFLQLWHLVFPVDWRAMTVVVLGGTLGLAFNARQWLAWAGSLIRRRPLALAVILLLVLWMSNRAIGPCYLYDSGLYHLSTVRWVREFPIVPGIGNLHFRLALNNSNQLFAAMLECGPWVARSSHLVNGLMTVMLLIQCVAAAFRIFGRSAARAAPCMFDLVVLGFVAIAASGQKVTSLTTDLAPGFVAVVAISRFIALLLRDKDMPPAPIVEGDPLGKESGGCQQPESPSSLLIADQESRLGSAYDVVFILTVLAMDICFKVGTIVFATTLSLAVLGYFIVWARRVAVPIARTTIAAAILCSMLVVPWMIRGYIQSGYPAFPSPMLGMDFDWKVPQSVCVNVTAWVRRWAKLYTVGDPVGWEWLDNWCKYKLPDLYPPLIAAGTGAMMLAAGCVLRRRAFLARMLLLLPAPAAAAAFWFFNAPDPRLGLYILWVLAGTLVAMAFYLLLPNGRWRACVTVPSVAIFVVLAAHWASAEVAKQTIVVPDAGRTSLERITGRWILPRGPDNGFHPDLGRVEQLVIPPDSPQAKEGFFAPYVTRSGLIVYCPRNGDMCWDGPLPCTPYPKPNLSLRRNNDMASGFKKLPSPLGVPPEAPGEE